MRIENAAEEYISGKIEIVLEKTEDRKDTLTFELDVKLLDKVKLMKIERALQGDKDTDYCLDEQNKVIKTIIDRSYPDMSDSWKENIAMRYGNNILLELYFIWEWRDREAFKAQQELKKKTIEDMKKGNLSPTQNTKD